MKGIRKGSILALLMSFVLALGPSRASGRAAGPDVAASIDVYLAAAHKLQWFSGSVLVARGGRIILNRGYGMADYELDVPNTPKTKFRLGSVSKQFTAMAILQLEERGKLKVTDTVQAFFTDYPGGDKITIHHLLTHTSGIPNYTAFPDYLKLMTLPSTALQMVDRFKNLPLDFAPGEKFNYSNSGYVLLGAVIEKVTGESYEKFVRENIFQPLGMDDSGYDHPETILKNRASGYEFSDDAMVNTPYIDMSIPYAAGALYSTVIDLYKWDRALYTEKLISKAALDRMFTPVESKGGLGEASAPSKNNYGYGWMINTVAGRKSIHHGGGVNGFITDILRFPDDDACVIVLNNYMTSYAQEIGTAVSGLLFGQSVEMPKERKFVKLPVAILDAYPGRYQLEGRPTVFSITRDGDRLFVQTPERPRMALLAESETKFFVKSMNMSLTFIKDGAGRVTHFLLLQGKRETKAVKVE